MGIAANWGIWERHMKTNSVAETEYGVWVIRRIMPQRAKIFERRSAILDFQVKVESFY